MQLAVKTPRYKFATTCAPLVSVNSFCHSGEKCVRNSLTSMLARQSGFRGTWRLRRRRGVHCHEGSCLSNNPESREVNAITPRTMLGMSTGCVRQGMIVGQLRPRAQGCKHQT